MGINFNSDISNIQVNPLIIKPQQQQEVGGAKSVDLSMNGSILTPDNINIAEQNTPVINVETIEVEMDDFLAEMNLSSLNADDIAAANTNSMPNQVVQLLDNKSVSTVDITYNPTDDGSVVTEHFSQDKFPKLLFQILVLHFC